MNKDQIIFKNLVLGSFLASLSAFLGGSTFVFTRLLVENIDPFTLSFLRYGLTGLILFLLSISYFFKNKFDKVDLIPMSLLGLAMISLFSNFMALGLEHTTASRAGLLYATMPLCTIVIAFFFKIEKITFNKSLAVLIAISGVTFCMSEKVDDNLSETLKGDFLMMIGVLAASCFTVFSGKYLKKYGNIQVMIFLMLVIPGGVLMMFCWGKALQLISPTQAAISLGFNPLSAILLGYLILNEPVTFRLAIGFTSIIFAILLANWKLNKK